MAIAALSPPFPPNVHLEDNLGKRHAILPKLSTAPRLMKRWPFAARHERRNLPITAEPVCLARLEKSPLSNCPGPNPQV
jgi:hypothetical protein